MSAIEDGAMQNSDRYIPTDTEQLPVDEQLRQLIAKRAPGSTTYARALAELTRLRERNAELDEELDAYRMDGASCSNRVIALEATVRGLREALEDAINAYVREMGATDAEASRQEDVIRFRAALDAAAADGDAGWQPIETAPKEREWMPETPMAHRQGVVTAFDEETGESLFLVYYKYCGNGASETTHWMPLPAPPSAH